MLELMGEEFLCRRVAPVVPKVVWNPLTLAWLPPPHPSGSHRSWFLKVNIKFTSLGWGEIISINWSWLSTFFS